MNKFLGQKNEGHRGILVALSQDKKQGIVLSLTQSRQPDDGVLWGCLYLVVQSLENEWPRVAKRVDRIPEGMRIPDDLLAQRNAPPDNDEKAYPAI